MATIINKDYFEITSGVEYEMQYGGYFQLTPENTVSGNVSLAFKPKVSGALVGKAIEFEGDHVVWIGQNLTFTCTFSGGKLFGARQQGYRG